MTSQIMLIDSQMADLQATKHVLSQGGYNVVEATSGISALKQIESMVRNIDMVILNAALDELNGFEVCRSLRRHPETVHLPILAFTAPTSREQKTEMFEAGADDCMSKPYEPSELLARVKVQLRRSKKPTGVQAAKSKIFAVYSLRGGSGVTTLATNLSVSLAQLWNEDVVLVDLVLASSQARLMFNLLPNRTWEELGRVSAEDIDDHLLNTMLLQHSSGVSVLPAPRVQECREPLDGARIRHTLSLLRARYRYVVLDMPHDLQEGTVAALEESDKILSVMVPDVASLANQLAALETFKLMNYSSHRVRIVMNRIHERNQVDSNHIETTLKRPVDVVIPFAGDAATEAINLGQPLTLAAPESAVSTALEDFAFHLSKKDHSEGQPAEPSQAWQRASRRLSHQQRKGLGRFFGWGPPPLKEPELED